MTVATRGAPTEHLTNAEIRAAICEAALKNDPVSLYHVALMYQNGWGFPRNDAKAASAIRQSEMAMIAALGGESLPAWKREAYKAYAAKIRASAKELKKPEAGADDAICK
jgi:TPR repeat protein